MGKKFEILSKVVVFSNAIAIIIAMSFAFAKLGVVAGLAILFGGTLFTVVIYFLLDGFGQIVDNSNEIAAFIRNLNIPNEDSTEDENEEMDDQATVFINDELSQDNQ